jgi:hypothetical protein
MIDSIVWGNPSQKDYALLHTKSPYDKYIPDLIKVAPPLNSSKATREELNSIVDYVYDFIKIEESTQKRYKNYDQDIELSLVNILVHLKIADEAGEMVSEIYGDIMPLIYKLKYHFQRPRPYQLALQYKIKLFPTPSFSSSSPSYPSAQSVLSKVICHVIGNNFPEHYNTLDQLTEDISYSRIYMGLNYQSDLEYSHYVKDLIVNDPEFKAKYNL